LFFCGGVHRPTSAAKAGNGLATDLLTIDIHCHAHIPAADALVAAAFDPAREPMLRHATDETRAVNREQMAALQPRLTTAAARLEDMDRIGIDIQAISPSPFQYFYWAEPDLGRAASRCVNDGIASLMAQAPERFVGIGTVPMQAPQLAIDELDRTILELGFRGVQLATNVDGAELSDPRFRSFFARAEELGIPIFLHPNGFTDGRRLGRHYLINTIGNPLDTSVAVAHLILDGVIDEFPALKILLAHGGGFVGAYPARLDHAYKARADCRGATPALPSEKLRSFYYDTCVFSALQLEFLIRQFGADHVVLGTDYPYDMGEENPLGLISSVSCLDHSDTAKIVGLNAASLLDLASKAQLKIQSNGRGLPQRSPTIQGGDL
jgi:aminocarboxymuconate-semialdehyde decarboxylase